MFQSFADSNVTCSITPTRSDSKVLVSASVTGEGNATNQARFAYRIKKRDRWYNYVILLALLLVIGLVF